MPVKCRYVYVRSSSQVCTRVQNTDWQNNLNTSEQHLIGSTSTQYKNEKIKKEIVFFLLVFIYSWCKYKIILVIK